MRITRILAAPALAVALLVVAGPAQADTYCVHQGAYVCLGTIDKGAGLQAALDAAATSPQSSKIIVGPGTYTAPILNGFGYNDPSQLEIVGSNTDFDDAATVITAPSPGFTPVLQVAGGAANEVKALQVRLPNANDALGLSYAGTATDVTVTRAPGGTGGTGVRVEGPATVSSTFRGGRISLGAEGVGIWENTSGTLTVETSTVIARTGIVDHSGPALITHTNVTAADTGILLGADTVHKVEYTLVRVTGGPTARGLYAYQAADVRAHHVTLVGDGAGRGALAGGSDVGQQAELTLESSVVSDFGPDIECAGVTGSFAKLTLRHSRYDDDNSNAACVALDTSTANTSAPPEFVDPTATINSPGTNFRLRWSSDLIDAGNPSDLPVGTDLGGGDRRRDGDGDGNADFDMGAYEYQRLAPTATASAPADADAGQPVAFTGGGTDPDPGDELAFAWSFDDGASGSGAMTSHAFSAGGPHSGTVTVTDPTGLSASAVAPVSVSAAPTTPDAPATPGGGPVGGGATGGATGGGADTSRPLISGVAFRPATFAPSTAATAISARTRRGTELRYRLSEASRVSLRVERVLAGRRSAGACRAPSRRLLRAPRCTRHVGRGTLVRAGDAGTNRLRFSGRIGRRALAAGAYRLVVTATDATGNRARPVSARFTVVRG